MAQDTDVQALRGGEPDRTPFVRQETKAGHQVQERQLVAKVQRNFQLVSKEDEPSFGIKNNVQRNRFQTSFSRPFSSIIGNEDASSSYELHIGVKDYCFGRDDRLIGVSVMQLKDIQNQVSAITITIFLWNFLFVFAYTDYGNYEMYISFGVVKETIPNIFYVKLNTSETCLFFPGKWCRYSYFSRLEITVSSSPSVGWRRRERCHKFLITSLVQTAINVHKKSRRLRNTFYVCSEQSWLRGIIEDIWLSYDLTI